MLYIIYHEEGTVIPKIIVAVNRLAIRVDINKHQDPLYFTFFPAIQNTAEVNCTPVLSFSDILRQKIVCCLSGDPLKGCVDSIPQLGHIFTFVL